MKIDWKRKLSSRKLWMAVAGAVVGIVKLFQGGDGDLYGTIILLGAVVSYIAGEGWVDKGQGETGE